MTDVRLTLVVLSAYNPAAFRFMQHYISPERSVCQFSKVNSAIFASSFAVIAI